MPCNTDGWAEHDLRVEVDGLKKQADAMARMLCSACKVIFQHASLSSIGVVELQELSDWNKAHNEADRKRELRESAFSKLTDDELAALGIRRP